jgi:hypothetical protein
MIERLLSPRGLKIYFGALLVMFGYVIWLRIRNDGVIIWLDYLQAQYLLSGRYYPKVSLMILVIPVVAISTVIGFSHDFFSGQGIFARYENSADLSKPISKAKMEYQTTTRKEAIDEIRSKYQIQISQLKTLGFEELGFYREIIPWFGLQMGSVGFNGALGVLSNEVTRLGPNLTVNIFYILMASRDEPAYVAVANLGVIFCTGLTDGTCLLTTSYKGYEVHSETYKLHKISLPGSLESTWQGHRLRVKAFEMDGGNARENLGIEDYFLMMRQLGEYTVKYRSKLSKPA